MMTSGAQPHFHMFEACRHQPMPSLCGRDIHVLAASRSMQLSIPVRAECCEWLAKLDLNLRCCTSRFILSAHWQLGCYGTCSLVRLCGSCSWCLHALFSSSMHAYASYHAHL